MLIGLGYEHLSDQDIVDYIKTQENSEEQDDIDPVLNFKH